MHQESGNISNSSFQITCQSMVGTDFIGELTVVFHEVP